jgi:HSP20 family molecular chaperone IbpA
MAPNRYLSVLDLAEEFLRDFTFDAPSKLPDVFVTSRFPPCNILKKEDNSLEYEFAVAGYDLSEIGIEFDNDHLILSLEPKEKEEDKTIKYRQMGIRRAKSTSKFFVPVSHYDVEKAVANLDKGILKLSIPTKEVAKPRRIEIGVN